MTNQKKDFYVLYIFNNNYIASYDYVQNKSVFLNIDSLNDSFEYGILKYIEQQLVEYNDINELRRILSKIQVCINSSTRENMLENIEKYFNQNVNNTSKNEQIDSLLAWKNQLLNSNNSNAPGEVTEEVIEGGRGRQFVKNNGHSLLDDNKNAFINALVLALIVEVFGLVMFTILLFKLI